VLSIAAPFGGNLWYLITLISPAAGAYYLRKGDRQEEVMTGLRLRTLMSVHLMHFSSASQQVVQPDVKH
jgi:Cofactor assembly of complex C subunit B